jgi:hypothetical protein
MFRVPFASDVVVMVNGTGCTVNVVFPVMPLSVAVIVVLPGLTAVANPALVIVATVVIVEAQVTELVTFCVLPLE